MDSMFYLTGRFAVLTRQIIVLASLLTVILASPIVASISVLNEDGKIYHVNTVTGVATLSRTVLDPAGSTQTQFSPNSLGVSGANDFYTTFNVPGNEGFYRDTTQLLSLSAANNAIAAGDALGSNFYYVDRDGKFVTIGNIFAAAAVSSSVQIGGFSGATLGDLAIIGTTAYLSYDTNKLSTFDITNPGAGFTSTITRTRMVGLGFDNGVLYGVLRNSSTDFDLVNALTGVKIADITGVESGKELTDASRAAVPEFGALVTWLILASGSIGFVSLRRKLHMP